MSNNMGTPNPIFSVLIPLLSIGVAMASLYNSKPSLAVPFICIFIISLAVAAFQAVARRNPTAAALIFILVAISAFFLGSSYSTIVSVPQKASTGKPSSTISFTSPTTDNEENQLTQEEAGRLVKSWLKAKSQILGDSFDQEKLKQLATGMLYKDVNNQIYSLKREGNSYRFRSYTTKTVLFSSGSRAAFLIVEVQGEYSYNGSPFSQDNDTYTYIFEKKESDWKITNYVGCNILVSRCEQKGK